MAAARGAHTSSVGRLVSPYDSAVHEFLETLEEHRQNCERLGKYADADIARQRILELREHEVFRKKEALRARHLAEMLGVEEANMAEFQAFSAAWEARMAEFEEHASATIASVQDRHVGELMQYQQKLLVRSAYPRHSREYFNLRRIEETLAKQKNYAAAGKIKEKADALMAEEEERWNNERQVELFAKEAAFKAKLAAELESVKKRLTQSRADLARNRQLELERLLVKCANVKTELERHQKIESQRLDRELSVELKLIKAQGFKVAGL